MRSEQFDRANRYAPQASFNGGMLSGSKRLADRPRTSRVNLVLFSLIVWSLFATIVWEKMQ